MGDLITFVVLPTTNLYGMFAIPIGRIYTNVSPQHTMGMPSPTSFFRKTLLDTLLTRETLKAEMVGTYDLSGAVSYSATVT